MLGFLIRASIVALGFMAGDRLGQRRVHRHSGDLDSRRHVARDRQFHRPADCHIAHSADDHRHSRLVSAGDQRRHGGLVAWMLPGMHVAGFWPAFWTSVLVSLVSFVGSWFVGGKGKVEIIISAAEAPLEPPLLRLRLGKRLRIGEAAAGERQDAHADDDDDHADELRRADRCSCRNCQPRNEAIAGFT